MRIPRRHCRARRQGSPGAAAALVVFAVGALRLAATARAPPVELNPSILVLGSFDYVPYQTEPLPGNTPFTSRCTDMVDRALLRAGGSTLAWVPTMYWTSAAADKSVVQGFCFMVGTDGNTKCMPLTQVLIQEFREGLQRCMQLASNKGVNELAVVPHLDDATRLGAAWRNAVSFAPSKKYDGFSYEEAMLHPVADALGSVAKPWSIIHLALQGEMSATVMRYPGQYLDLVARIRQRVIAAAAAQGVELKAKRVQVGLSFNYNKVELDGLQLPASVPVAAPAAAPVAAAAAVAPPPSPPPTPPPAVAAASPLDMAPLVQQLSAPSGRVDLSESVAGLVAAAAAASGGGGRRRQLRQAAGRVAITPSLKRSRPVEDQRRSGTPGLTEGAAPTAPAPVAATIITIPPASSGDLAGLLDTPTLQALLTACDFIGISAYASLNKVDFAINELQNSVFTFFDEFKQTTGLDVATLMKTHRIALHYSEFGLGGGLDASGTVPVTTALQAAKHPYWGVYPKTYTPELDPWRIPEVNTFMVSFWRKATSWLSQGGGPSFFISKAFMWTLGSYDVLAIYPESTPSGGSNGGYFTAEVSQALLAHNTRTAEINRAALLAGGAGTAISG